MHLKMHAKHGFFFFFFQTVNHGHLLSWRRCLMVFVDSMSRPQKTRWSCTLVTIRSKLNGSGDPKLCAKSGADWRDTFFCRAVDDKWYLKALPKVCGQPFTSRASLYDDYILCSKRLSFEQFMTTSCVCRREMSQYIKNLTELQKVRPELLLEALWLSKDHLTHMGCLKSFNCHATISQFSLSLN